jgi:hypothetical protein
MEELEDVPGGESVGRVLDLAIDDDAEAQLNPSRLRQSVQRDAPRVVDEDLPIIEQDNAKVEGVPFQILLKNTWRTWFFSWLVDSVSRRELDFASSHLVRA